MKPSIYAAYIAFMMGPYMGQNGIMKQAKTPPAKLNLRLPEDLKQHLQTYADSVGVSANTAVLLAIRNFLPFAIKQAKSLRMAAPKSMSTGQALASAARPIDFPKVGRNQPCPCGSGKKARFCHQP